jgi:hypothetical protein
LLISEARPGWPAGSSSSTRMCVIANQPIARHQNSGDLPVALFAHDWVRDSS